MTANGLDPAGPILAALFEANSSDTIVDVADGAGLPVDWTLTDRQASSRDTRKREYRVRIGEALKRISAVDRTKVLSRFATGVIANGIANVDSLNRALAPTGWLFVEGDLVQPIQGPTEPDAFLLPIDVQTTAVIVTALELEANAVKEHLSGVAEQHHEKGTVYFVGDFDGGDRHWRVAIVIAGPGNPTAAVEVERAVAHFKPSALLLVGIAGALKDLDLGDVVAADKVYGYERGKAEHEFRPRPTVGLSTYAATQQARAEVSKGEWQARIKGEQSKTPPKAVVAPIAAGEKVVASFESATFKDLANLFSDAVAVEMEGAGFLAAAHSNMGVNALVVRGISDRIEGKTAADASGSQQRAARNAAAFAFQFLAHFGHSTESRREHVERLLRESRARCIERWQGAGVSRELAAVLADDGAVGISSQEMRPSRERPFVVLLGDFGGGKSLRSERLYQEALLRCLTDLNAPVPIYVEVFPNKLPTLAELRALASLLGDVEQVGAAVFLERADEGGQKHAVDCLALGRQILGTWRSTTVVMPSRPMSAFVEIPEAIEMPLLTESDACALVSRVSGYPFGEQDLWRWSGMLHEALRRPLFGILVGLYVQTEHERNTYLSAGELIGRVIEQALRRSRVDLMAAEKFLSRLGVISVDRGGEFVHYSQVGGLLEIEPIFGSGLIARHGDALGFAIPVIGQWFAAQAVAQRQVAVEEIVADRRRSELWRYPFAIVAASSSGPVVHDLLRLLALNDPGLAALILDDAARRTFGNPSVSALTSAEYEACLQVAWNSWVSGVGDLAQAVNATGPAGQPLLIKARLAKPVLSIGWYRESPLESPSQSDEGQLPGGWVRCTRVGGPSDGPPWAWQFTLDNLKTSLRESLRRHALPSDDRDPLVVEAVWSGSLELARHGSLHPGPIAIEQIDRALSGHLGQVRQVHTFDYGNVDISLIKDTVKRLKDMGSSELQSPLPTQDIHAPTDNWVWSLYSEARLLERTRAVYQLAIIGYCYIADRWFSRLRSRMLHAATLPAKFRGVLLPSRLRPGEADPTKHPVLDYWFEPLPFGSESQVDIVLGPAPGFLIDDFDEAAWGTLRRMRPDAAGWIWTAKGGTLLDVFGSCPATKIAYEWLIRDLERIKWA